jgi:hypothetical protein
MNFSKFNGFPSNGSIQQPSIYLPLLSNNKLQCMDEGGAAIMLLKLVQFQEAYVVQGNFRKKIVFRAEQIYLKLESSKNYCVLMVVLNIIFIRIWIFFKQLLHPQCLAELLESARTWTLSFKGYIKNPLM